MVAAKSRLQKVSNVRKKLHKYKGTPSQRLQELKMKTVGAIQKGVSKAKTLASAVGKKFKMPPPVKMSQKTIQDAVSNVQKLQSRVPLQPKTPSLPKKVPPPITTPSPASLLKGPLRPPPPPPNQTPMRPMIQGAKVAPKVPPKPMALKGRKL
jgi:hypothetical protein